MIIIPIGIQCTNATILKDNNMRFLSFPFDWMFSTPKFIFEMLELLLENNISIDDLVKNHFLYCEKKANVNGYEKFYTCDNGGSLYNSKYNVIFPHDNYNTETINKYIRRFERLKDIIINAKEELCFFYISQSSSEYGNFTIDGKKVVCDVYFYLSKIYHIIGKYNNNYKIIVFDALKEESKELLNENICVYELNKCDRWDYLVNQIDINLLK